MRRILWHCMQQRVVRRAVLRCRAARWAADIQLLRRNEEPRWRNESQNSAGSACVLPAHPSPATSASGLSMLGLCPRPPCPCCLSNSWLLRVLCPVPNVLCGTPACDCLRDVVLCSDGAAGVSAANSAELSARTWPSVMSGELVAEPPNCEVKARTNPKLSPEPFALGPEPFALGP